MRLVSLECFNRLTWVDLLAGRKDLAKNGVRKG